MRCSPRTIVATGAALLVLSVGLSELDAQARRGRAPNTFDRTAEVGVRGGYDFDAEDWSIGGQGRIPIARIIEVLPSGDLYLVDNGTAFQLNLDLAVPLAPRGALYGGGGAGFFLRDPGVPGVSTSTDVGLNLLVGLEPGRLRRSRIRWFAEARWFLVEGNNPFRLVAGLNFPIGGGRGR